MKYIYRALEIFKYYLLEIYALFTTFTPLHFTLFSELIALSLAIRSFLLCLCINIGPSGSVLVLYERGVYGSEILQNHQSLSTVADMTLESGRIELLL